jgi:hypothetical protein
MKKAKKNPTEPQTSEVNETIKLGGVELSKAQYDGLEDALVKLTLDQKLRTYKDKFKNDQISCGIAIADMNKALVGIGFKGKENVREVTDHFHAKGSFELVYRGFTWQATHPDVVAAGSLKTKKMADAQKAERDADVNSAFSFKL